MTKVCRNILIWAVSVASAIPATALEGQAGLKPHPIVGVRLALLQETAAPAPPAALSTPASNAPDTEASSFGDQAEQGEQEAEKRDREQEARDRAQE